MCIGLGGSESNIETKAMSPLPRQHFVTLSIWCLGVARYKLTLLKTDRDRMFALLLFVCKTIWFTWTVNLKQSSSKVYLPTGRRKKDNKNLPKFSLLGERSRNFRFLVSAEQVALDFCYWRHSSPQVKKQFLCCKFLFLCGKFYCILWLILHRCMEGLNMLTMLVICAVLF